MAVQAVTGGIALAALLGAAFGTAITEVMLMALAVRACPQGVCRRADALVLVRCGLAGCLLAGAMAAGLRLGGPVAAVASGVPLFVAAVLRLGVIRAEDIGLPRSALLSRLGRWDPGIGTGPPHSEGCSLSACSPAGCCARAWNVPGSGTRRRHGRIGAVLMARELLPRRFTVDGNRAL